MFNKVDKKAIADNNGKVEEELNQTKPQSSDDGKKRQVTGKIISTVGATISLIASVGAAVFILSGLSQAIGLGILTTILLLAGLGICCALMGSKLVTDSWLPQLGV